MIDNELRILFLKTKLENESRKLNTESFFKLIEHKVGWNRFHEVHSECVKNFLLDTETHIYLTDVGKHTLQTLEIEHEQALKDQKAERKKLHNDSRLSELQLKTFWWIFGLGIFGGLYSGYDFIKSLTTSKNVKEKQVTKEEMELELSKLRTLILDQKKDSVLIHSNSDKSK